MVTHLVPSVMIAVSCVAAVSAAGRSPSRLDVKPFVLAAAMAGECRASESVLALARSESARVWSRAGVSIRWVPPSELPYESSPLEWLLVRCADGATAAADSDSPYKVPIAAIRFIAERPTNTIVVNVDNADTLLQRDAPQLRGEPEWFVPFREIRLGRMLGRAIAHEIGHFLTQSGGHTRSGLMRASHSVAALTGPSLGPFRAPDTSQY